MQPDWYQKLIDLAGVIYVALNRQGEVTYINRYGCDILEYAPDELVGKNWFDTCVPEREREQTRQVFAQLMRDEIAAVEHHENAVLTRSGGERVVSWHNSVLREESGSPLGTLSAGLDVTARRFTEEALRGSELRYQTLAKVAPVGIFRADARGRFVYVNDRWCDITGLAPEQALGKGWQRVLHPEDRQKVVQNWRRAVASQSSLAAEYRLRRPEGTIVWVVERATPEYDQNRQVVAFVGMITEITERKQAEEAVKASEARLRAILETAVDGIVTIDESGVIESVNPAVERLFGYTAEELVGQNVGLLMPIEQRGDHDRYIDRYLSTGRKRIIGIGREVIGQKKDGTRFPLHLSVSEFFIGGRRKFTGILRDHSEQKQLQEKMIQAERLAIIGKMAAKVAHEIRNPLSSVSLNAELLEEEIAGLNCGARGQELGALIRAMIREIDRVTALTDEYLQFSRLPEARPSGGTFEQVVEEILEAVDGELKQKKIAVHWRGSAPPVRVGLDRIQFKRAVLNLIRNAIEAMPKGGRLSLWTERNERYGVLKIQDTGPGVPTDKLDQIFEPFFTTKEFGTGLGLAIAQQVVHEHGGRILCESAAGQGTTFSVEIPLVNPNEV